MTVREFFFRVFAALAFVLGEAILFAGCVTIVTWVFNVIVVEHFPSIPKVPFQLAIAFGILAGLINTGLNSFFKRKGLN